MNKTEVSKNGNIVYLNSVIWYTMTGGIESTNQMIDEIADAVKIIIDIIDYKTKA